MKILSVEAAVSSSNDKVSPDVPFPKYIPDPSDVPHVSTNAMKCVD